MKYDKIILLGFRGAGKSTLGEIIAPKLGWKLVELDQEISDKAGRTIQEITNNGADWVEFRKIETDLLKKYCGLKNIVICCGGGVGVNEVNGSDQRKILKDTKNSLQVVLSVPEKSLRNRLNKEYEIKGLAQRPAIGKIDKNESDPDFIEALIEDNIKIYRARKVYYEIVGDVTLLTEDKSSAEVAEIIEKMLRGEIPL
jgi:shikimate kinase